MPAKPKTIQYELWAAYAVRLLGINAIEVNKRAEVADCLDRERDAGRIR